MGQVAQEGHASTVLRVYSPEQPGVASALSLLPQGWDGGILSAKPATAVRDPRISNA